MQREANDVYAIHTGARVILDEHEVLMRFFGIYGNFGKSSLLYVLASGI